jgi:hypothetical protein
MDEFASRFGSNDWVRFRRSASAAPARHVWTRLIARSSVVAAGFDFPAASIDGRSRIEAGGSHAVTTRNS